MKMDLFYITPQKENVSARFENAFDLTKIVGSDTTVAFGKTSNLHKISQIGAGEYLSVQISNEESFLFENSLSRFLDVAQSTNAEIIYSDFIAATENGNERRSLIDYRTGSVRDDFEFGKFVLIKRRTLEKYFEENPPAFEFSAFYDFRLFASRIGKIVRIPETLYFTDEKQSRKTGVAIFDYVKEEYRALQKEREKVFTEHLKKINALLPSVKTKTDFDFSAFPLTASVIIPVKNRAKTIADAVKSALSQKTDFDFNVIVVDNYSTDGTSETLLNLAKENEKLVRIVPQEKHFGIGGCWNVAINDERCGAFAVQLDSDDIYANEFALQKIIDKFRETGAAAVVGSYVVTDFDLNEIPPGKVLHEEWTNENGHNNALRINGFGAPRAYYVPAVREIGFPDVSYGEDYAVMLALSARYRVARIFEPIYFARRWQGNSDADLSWEKKMRYDFYKDFLRTVEIERRKKLVRNQ